MAVTGRGEGGRGGGVAVGELFGQAPGVDAGAVADAEGEGGEQRGRGRGGAVTRGLRPASAD